MPPMTYATDRAVFFNPREVKVDRCMMCARPTTRISPRTLAARAPSGYGTVRIRSIRNALTLCEACDRRWSIATYVGLTLVFMPLWITPVMVFFTVQHAYLPIQALVVALLASFPIAIAAYVWARSKLIQCHSIDDDGLLGLRNVHPETRDAIVAIGEGR